MANAPRKVSKEELDKVLYFAPPLDHAAAYLDVSMEMIRHACEDFYGRTYNELRLKHRTKISNLLLATAIERATIGKSDSILRLLLGHFADVFDKQKLEISTPTVNLKYALEDSPQSIKDVTPHVDIHSEN